MKTTPHPSLPRTLAIAACSLFSATAAHATVLLSLTDAVGDPALVTIAPGDSFNVTLSLSSSLEATIGLSYFLQTIGAGDGQFRITARNIMASPFSDLTTADSIALQANNALLDPRNDSDLGGLVANLLSPNGTGSFLVATYTIEALSTIAPGGSYTIQTSADSIATDTGFVDMSLPQASYTVQVVPEPTTAALFGVALLGFSAAARRRPKMA